jgi:hypothetical protein
MANKKITELTAASSVVAADLLPVVTDTGGTPTTKSATLQKLLDLIFGTSRSFTGSVTASTSFVSSNDGTTIAYQVTNVSNTRTAYGITGSNTKGMLFNTDGNTVVRGGGASYYEVTGTLHIFVNGQVLWIAGDGNYHWATGFQRAPYTTQVGNTAATLTDLNSPPNLGQGAIATNGMSYGFESSGTFAATASTDKRVKVIFGTTTIFDSGSLAVITAVPWNVRGRIVRTGATTAKAMVEFWTGDPTNGPYKATFTSVTETLANALAFKVQGSGTNANDVLGEFHHVWLNSKT